MTYTPHEPLAGARFAPWVGVCCLFAAVTFSQIWVMAITGPDQSNAASDLVRNLFFPAYAATLVALALTWRTSLAAIPRVPVLTLLIVWVFVSMLWSTAPDQTMRRAVAVCLTTLCGLAIGANFGWVGIARILAGVLVIAGAASLIVALANPAYGVMHDLFPGAWRGVWYEKNLLGNNMTQGFVFALAAAVIDRRHRKAWATAAVLAAGLVVMSTSKTALLALGVGGCVTVFVGAVRRGPLWAIIAVWLAMTGLVALGLLLLLNPDLGFALLGKEASFTGRTRIWSAVDHLIQQRPWLGYGYGAVWYDQSVWAPLGWIVKQAGFRPFEAHSAWLEAQLGLGLVGLVLWSVIFVCTGLRALGSVFVSDGAYVALPYMVVFALTSSVESIAIVYNDFYWVAFVAVAVRLAAPMRPRL